MSNYITKFENSIAEYETLIKVPNLMKQAVLDYLSNTISTIENNLILHKKIQNLYLSIKNISEANIKRSYGVIYNQLCVLIISSSCAILEENFKNFIKSNWKVEGLLNYNYRGLKFSLSDLRSYDDFKIRANLGQMIIDKDTDLNFQNLDSYLRSLKGYFDIDIDLTDSNKQHIKFYQNCRNVIVHKDSITDDEFIKNVEGCNVKNYIAKCKVSLDENDWVLLKENFKELIKKTELAYHNKSFDFDEYA